MLPFLFRYLGPSTAAREQLKAVPRQDSENELRSTELIPYNGSTSGRDFVQFSQYPARNKHVGYRNEVISTLALSE